MQVAKLHCYGKHVMRIPMEAELQHVFAEVLLIKYSEFQRINVIWSP